MFYAFFDAIGSPPMEETKNPSICDRVPDIEAFCDLNDGCWTGIESGLAGIYLCIAAMFSLD